MKIFAILSSSLLFNFSCIPPGLLKKPQPAPFRAKVSGETEVEQQYASNGEQPHRTKVRAAEGDQQPQRMTYLRAALLYHVHAPTEQKLPEEALMLMTSDDYVKAQDEFSRRAIRERDAKKLDSIMAQAAATQRFRVVIALKLPEYDFEREGFSTTLTSETYIPLKSSAKGERAARRILETEGFAVRFSNIKQFGFAKLPRDRAEGYARSFAKSRDAALVIEFDIEGVGDDVSDTIWTYKSISGRITKLSLVYAPKNIWGKVTEETVLSELVL